MTGFVYAIGAESGPVKLGWSCNPVRRLGQISTGCPLGVRLLGLVRASKSEEARLHRLLEPWNIRGEWYERRGPVQALIASLRAPEPAMPKHRGRSAAPALSAIRRYRDAHGLTQEQMAARIGVTAAAICRWEQGKREPRREERRRLAEVIGVPVAELLEPIAGAAQ